MFRLRMFTHFSKISHSKNLHSTRNMQRYTGPLKYSIYYDTNFYLDSISLITFINNIDNNNEIIARFLDFPFGLFTLFSVEFALHKEIPKVCLTLFSSLFLPPSTSYNFIKFQEIEV